MQTKSYLHLFIKKLLFTIILLAIVSFDIPKILKNKINKVIKKTFQVESFQLKKELLPSESQTKVISTDNFYGIFTDNKQLGYLIYGTANSKMREFDYVVILDASYKIIQVKVLIYREEHGDEITSKRWLKQFFGLTPKDRAVLGENIDGISGATISVRSMTLEMNTILNDLKNLTKYDK